MAKPYVEIFVPATPTVVEVLAVGSRGPEGEIGPEGPPADPQVVIDEVLDQLSPTVDLTVLFNNALV